VAAILSLAHRWEEVEKQSFRVKGLEVSAGQETDSRHRNIDGCNQ